jgi:hypothetical protein
MISVSDAWKNIQERFLLPETFVEIDCTIADVGVQESATITGTNEADVSNTISTLYDTSKTEKYATNELNLWALDGTRIIAPDSAPYADTGYVGEADSMGSITVSLPEVHTSATAGVTITWGGRYNEYPTSFEIIARNGTEVVTNKLVEGNTSQVSAVFAQLQNYDSITINVLGWSLPYRRVRIEKFVIGHVMTFRKNDIFSYTHEQSGHLNSGELPKNSITFTLDNTDGRWNPNNPTGIEQYLSERQKLKVRYGLDVDGTIEWINAGTFYLSEWRVPSNGLEASFVARDIFEYLLNATYTGRRSGTIPNIVKDAFESAGVPEDFVYFLYPLAVLRSATIPEGEYTCAEIVQMCANALCCVIYQDRNGVLNIQPLNKADAGYIIPLSLSYSHPEIELSKPLKNVSVSYGDDSQYVLPVGNIGETQTVSNPLVSNSSQAQKVGEWVEETLSTRKVVRGEYRADPRLDVFDVVVVQSDKYGELPKVAITDIKYTYNGSFRGDYTGRVLA